MSLYSNRVTKFLSASVHGVEAFREHVNTFIFIHQKMEAYNRKQNFTLTTHKNPETHLLSSILCVCNFDINLFLCGTLSKAFSKSL